MKKPHLEKRPIGLVSRSEKSKTTQEGQITLFQKINSLIEKSAKSIRHTFRPRIER